MQLLDMETGGGELLKTFHHPSNKTQVTEAWQPNINLLKHTIAKQSMKMPYLLKMVLWIWPLIVMLPSTQN